MICIHHVQKEFFMLNNVFKNQSIEGERETKRLCYKRKRENGIEIVTLGHQTIYWLFTYNFIILNSNGGDCAQFM